MSEFKVGDRIRAIDDYYVHTSKEHKWEGVITKGDSDIFNVKTTKSDEDNIDKEYYSVSAKHFEKIHTKQTKNELLKMPIGTKIITDAKEDNEFIFSGEDFYNSEYEIDQYEINDDLTLDLDNDDFGTKIIAIQEPDYRVIYEYEKEDKVEMTIGQIEEKLGHGVKIIKEED